MEILSIIPARGGSKGIKRKNIKLINEKPLIAYSIEASLNSKYITKTLLSSEDDEILEIAQRHGAEILKRPVELAQDETKTAPVMLQVVEELEKNNYKPDYVVLLQPTSPLRDSNYIDSAMDYYFKKQKAAFAARGGASRPVELWQVRPHGDNSRAVGYACAVHTHSHRAFVNAHGRL